MNVAELRQKEIEYCKGDIEYFSCDEKLYNHNDMWDEVGKDAHKVKRLVRTN